MRALTVLADSLRAGYVHPTTVLNTLIELENTGGAGAVAEFEQHLVQGHRSLTERQHPHAKLAHAWLEATRFYLSEHQTPGAA